MSFLKCVSLPDWIFTGANAVLMYASKYDDVQPIVNIAGRFNLRRGIEGRLGKDFEEKMEQYGFIDVKNRRGKLFLFIPCHLMV